MTGTRRRRPGLLLALLVLVSLTLVALDTVLQGRGPFPVLRNAATSVLGPLQEAGRFLSNRESELAELRADNARLRTENAMLRAYTEGQNAEPNRYAGYRLLPARVIAYGPAQAFTHTVALDAGRRAGIDPHATVLSADGLVGRVIRVGRDTATVLLSCDGESTVGARLEGSGELGLVTGDGDLDGALTLRTFDASASIRAGDRLLSWGSEKSSPYVPGVPIGTVRSVTSSPDGLGRIATVAAAVDFTTLDEVSVVDRKVSR